MPARSSSLIWAVLVSALSACAFTPTSLKGRNAEPGGDIVGTNQGTTSGTSAATSGGQLAGVILDESGNPAANVTVTAFLTNASPLANASALTNGSALTNASPYCLTALADRTLQSEEIAVTDAQGHFSLTPIATGEYNLEAVQNDDAKAFIANVDDSGARPVALGDVDLAPTGTITGRVTAPGAPQVSNFLGADVFIPGSSYVAKTAADGTYTLSNVASGSFSLVATKVGSILGDAQIDGVAVRPEQQTIAPDLAMSLSPPSISAISPANGAEGSSVLITGNHFGVTAGDTLEVTFNGAIASSVMPIDDRTIRVAVPFGASNGNVVVTVDGIDSNAEPFYVLSRLFLNYPAISWLLGEPLQLTASGSDTAGQSVASPAISSWAVNAGPTVASVSAGGLVTPLALGDATVSVYSGILSQTAAIHVFELDAPFALSPATMDLLAAPGSLTTAAPGQSEQSLGEATQSMIVTLDASDATHSLELTSSDPALVTVSPATLSVEGTASVLVQATSATGGGTAILTAELVDDPTVVATASVRVDTLGQLDLLLQ